MKRCNSYNCEKLGGISYGGGWNDALILMSEKFRAMAEKAGKT